MYYPLKNEFIEHKRLFVFIHLLFWLVFVVGIIFAIVNPQILLDAVQRIHHNDNNIEVATLLFSSQ